MKDKSKIRRKFILEGLIAFFLAMTPLLFYFYKYIPPNADESWNLFYITFTNNGYKDVATAFYFYVGKLIPLVLLIIWFITCKQWWYHAILIPIAMYAFQSYSVLSEDVEKIDENEILYLVAVCMVIIPIVYLIRLKLVDKYVHGIDLEAMDKELKTLKEKQGEGEGEDKDQPNLISIKNPKEVGYKSLSEKINEKLSTNNIESHLKQFQNQLGDWLHFKS